MLKRTLDLLIVIILIILFWFPFLILCFLVYFNLGSPIFFLQERTGLNSKPFRLVKLRSMSGSCDVYGNLLPDELRLSRFGKWLRSTSVDELPGLWNVLKGDMSIVGPRPLLTEYVPLYTPAQSRRHCVLPGITGWAQVNGRNAISWEDKFKFDVWYVDHHSLRLDIKILWLTVKRVIARDGISSEGDATMPKFTGSSAKEPNS